MTVQITRTVVDPASLGGRWIAQLDNHCCDSRSTCVDRQPRHRFLEPIHNVKDEAFSTSTAANRGFRFLHSWKRWWSQSGSNRRPQACKASALPTELWPHIRCECSRMFAVTSRSDAAVVGREGVEPSTSRLSGVRSNHLSYRPPCLASHRAAGGVSQLRLHLPPPIARRGKRFQDEGT